MKYRRKGRSICRTVNISLSTCIAFFSLVTIRLANYKGSQDLPLQKIISFCHGDLIVRGWHLVISAKSWIGFFRCHCHRYLVLSIMSSRQTVLERVYGSIPMLSFSISLLRVDSTLSWEAPWLSVTGIIDSSSVLERPMIYTCVGVI